MSDIELKLAKKKDLQQIFDMQIESFKYFYNKYDDGSSPGAQTIDNVKNNFNKKDTTYFLINHKGTSVGALRLNRKSIIRGRISPIFILPKYQNLLIGQRAIKSLEKKYPEIKTWELSTIYQEKGLCHFYRKLGYKSFGKVKNIKRGLDHIAFRKIVI